MTVMQNTVPIIAQVTLFYIISKDNNNKFQYDSAGPEQRVNIIQGFNSIYYSCVQYFNTISNIAYNIMNRG